MSRKNTTFYAKAVSETRSVRVRDIFSAVLQKHTRDDLDTAFTAGLKGHIPEGGAMLDVWQKPWIFSRVLLYGALAWLIIVFLNLGDGMDAITIGAQFIVPAVVVPFVIVVFYWEMNIPRNIPIYDIIKFILFGGIVASVVNGVICTILNTGEIETASVAGLTEELTKLVIIAFILRRKDRCWGLNGLLIGAAVGAGFAIFETNGYGIVTLTEEGVTEAIHVLNLRGALAICGHVGYSAMYGGTLALAKGRDKLQPRHFVNPFFLITFFSAMLLHALWNADFLLRFLTNHGAYLEGIAGLLYGHNFIGIGVIFTLVEYSIIFWVLKMSLREVIRFAGQGTPMYAASVAQQGYDINAAAGFQGYQAQAAVPGQPYYNLQQPVFEAREPLYRDYSQKGAQAQAAPKMNLECVSGALCGEVFSLEAGRVLNVGRGKDNDVRYADDEKGISGKHCSIGFNGIQAVLTDLGSSYGTFTGSGEKLQPHVEVLLDNGAYFWLAGEQNMFRIRIL